MPAVPLRFIPLIGLMLLSNSLCAGVETTPRYDQIELSAEAVQETDNDTLVAVLSAQKEGADPAALSDQVNRLIKQAISESEQFPEIKLQTLGYRTTPVYQQQRVTGWRVKQSLRLESRNSAKLSKLLSRLQSSLALESISYSVSDERRHAVEEALIKQALEAFQQRAQLITKQLGRSAYRLVELRVESGNQPVRPMRMRAEMMAMESSVASPRLEAGSQTLRVIINGRIELQLD